MNKLALLAIVLWHLAASAGANFCTDVLNSSVLRDGDFDAMFVRVAGSALDPVYRANMIRVAREFETAISADQPIADFKQFLKQQHIEAVLSADGSNYYWPEVYNHNGQMIRTGIDTARGMAGLFRTEWPTISVDQPLKQEETLGLPMVNEMKTRGADTEIQTVFRSGIPSRYYVPHITGVPETAYPRFMITGMQDKIAFEYPAARNLPAYIREMAKNIELVRENLRASPVDREAVLRPLARYYQLVITGHPFVHVNNSLSMAHVNVVLRKLGMEPVPHGKLDYLMRSLNTSDAETAFLDYLKQNSL